MQGQRGGRVRGGENVRREQRVFAIAPAVGLFLAVAVDRELAEPAAQVALQGALAELEAALLELLQQGAGGDLVRRAGKQLQDVEVAVQRVLEFGHGAASVSAVAAGAWAAAALRTSVRVGQRHLATRPSANGVWSGLLRRGLRRAGAGRRTAARRRNSPGCGPDAGPAGRDRPAPARPSRAGVRCRGLSASGVFRPARRGGG